MPPSSYVRVEATFGWTKRMKEEKWRNGCKAIISLRLCFIIAQPKSWHLSRITAACFEATDSPTHRTIYAKP